MFEIMAKHGNFYPSINITVRSAMDCIMICKIVRDRVRTPDIVIVLTWFTCLT